MLRRIPGWAYSAALFASFCFFGLAVVANLSKEIKILSTALLAATSLLQFFRKSSREIQGLKETKSCPACEGTGRVKKEEDISGA